MRMRNLVGAGFAAALTVAVFGAAPANAHPPGRWGMMGSGMMYGQGCQPWMMGPGMMYGQGYSGMRRYGMMGPGMMGPGMMGSGMMGSGMMGPGMMGSGMIGPGMMGSGMMGPGMMYGQGYGPGMMGPGVYGRQGNLNLSTDDVKNNLERWIAVQGNPHLNVGDVKEKDNNTIEADIVTKEGNALVQRFTVDRQTGFYRPSRS